MATRCSPRFFPCLVAAVTTLVFAAGAPLPAQNPPRPSAGDAASRREEIRKRIEQAKAESKKRSDAIKKKLGTPPSTPTGDPDQRYRDAMKKFEETRRSLEKGRQDAEAARLQYRFTAGQVFAYRVDLLQEGDLVERHQGTFAFQVKTVDPKGETELRAIGKLDYFSRGRDEERFTAGSAEPIWIGTYIRTDPQGDRLTGKPDQNFKDMPYLLTEFVKLKQLIFPELPRSNTDQIGEDGSGMLFETRTGGLLGPTLKTSNGRKYRWISAQPVPPQVRITTEVGFRETEGPKREWRFVGTSQFDPQRGLVVATDATHRYLVKGADAGPPLRITIRLLEGDDLTKALAKANRDEKVLLPDLRPVELSRVRLELRDADRFKSAQQARPGMAVAHFRDVTGNTGGDYKWYLAEVLQVLDNGKVEIRYRGSNEVFDVPHYQLALAPAGTK